MNNWSIQDLIDDQTARELGEIAGLLEEAYEHYFEFSAGWRKAPEGSIYVDIPEYFWQRHEGEAVERPSVAIGSSALAPQGIHPSASALAPQGIHPFENSTDALEAVREWHEREMARVYDEHGEIVSEAREGNK